MNKFINVSSYYLENLLMSILVSFPILALILKKWMNACLFAASIISLLLIMSGGWGLLKKQVLSRPSVRCISIAFIAPFFGLLVAQLFKGQINVGNLDSLSKLFLAVPVLYWLLLKPFNPLPYFEWTIPTAVFVTGANILINPNLEWTTDGVVRITTYFVDPLSFSALIMELALICLGMFNLRGGDGLVINLFKFSAFLIGIYLSFISGSRSSWLAIIPALWLWLRCRTLIPVWLVMILVTVAVSSVVVFVPYVKERVLLAISDISHYSWNEVNHETSVEMRLTFYRIGWELFTQSPWLGWGDHGFVNVLNETRFTSFASDFTRQFVLGQGFHNELVTNMVRSGVFGLIPVLLILSLPFWYFVKALSNVEKQIQGYGLQATNYYSCVLITSLTTEIFNIKFVSSFHAMMLAIFCGVIINELYPNGTKDYDR